MSVLNRIVAILGLAAIRAEIGAMLGRVRFLALLLGVGAILWLMAFAYALAALTLWLSGLVGGVFAALILTVVFVIGALATHVIAVVTKPPPSPLAETVAAATEAVASATQAVAAAIAPPKSDPPPDAGATEPDDADTRPGNDGVETAEAEAPPTAPDGEETPVRAPRRRRPSGTSGRKK